MEKQAKFRKNCAGWGKTSLLEKTVLWYTYIINNSIKRWEFCMNGKLKKLTAVCLATASLFTLNACKSGGDAENANLTKQDKKFLAKLKEV